MAVAEDLTVSSGLCQHLESTWCTGNMCGQNTPIQQSKTNKEILERNVLERYAVDLYPLRSTNYCDPIGSEESREQMTRPNRMAV